MSCKYLKESKMYCACAMCNEKSICKSAITYSPLIYVRKKDVIPFASEANKMTNNTINHCMTQELERLSKLIKNAIMDGNFSISEEGSLKPEIRKKLEELGYKVDVGGQYYYIISWR